MDKICRGSALSEAHKQGSWGDAVAHVDTARNARGTHITTSSFKLENTAPTGFRDHARQRFTSDTFRTSDWFRHDPKGNEGNVPQLSTRFWQSSKGQGSPRSFESRSKSQINLAEEDLSAMSPRAVDIQRQSGMSPRGPTRSKSMGFLGMQAGQGDVEVALFDGQRSPRQGQRSPRSPRPNHPAGLPVERGRCLDFNEDGAPVRQRSASPTYETSTNWMAWSSGAVEKPVDGDSTQFMPSRNFNSKMRHMYSGCITQETEEKCFTTRGELAAEPSAPPASDIANIVDHKPSKGKKTNMQKPVDGAKRRLKLDATQPASKPSERKHAFPELPQSQRQLEEFKLSPRMRSPRVDADTGAVDSVRKPCIVDVQHRTSAEMASSMMPEQAESSAPNEQRKYMVGQEIISWANCGRRGAPECFLNTQRVAAQISREAGGCQAVPPNSLGNVRDHRNSELVREHLKSQPSTWQEQLTVGPQVMPQEQQPGRVRNALPSKGSAGLPADRQLVAYGDVSSLPATTPKDTAYLTSGLKVYKYGARTPGYFSPYIPHAQIVCQQ
jgi:hypothetical protein